MQLLLFFLASSQRNGSGTRGSNCVCPWRGWVCSISNFSVNTIQHQQTSPQSPAIRNNQLSRPPAAGLNSSKGGNPVPASPHTVTGPTFQRANDLCQSGRCFSLPGTVAAPSRPVPCLTLVQRGTSCTCNTVRYLVCLNPVLRTALPYTVSGAAQARPWTPGPTPTNTITSGPGRLLLNHHNSTTLPTTTTDRSVLLTFPRPTIEDSIIITTTTAVWFLSSSSTTPHLLHEGLAVRPNHRSSRFSTRLPPARSSTSTSASSGLGLRRVGRHDDTSASPRCFPLQPERPVVASY